MRPVVPRDRLLRLLDGVPHRSVSQVVGPVGIGKSTLVAHWAEGRDVRWLRRDEHHRLLEQVLDLHHQDATTTGDSDVRRLRDVPPGTPRAVVVIDDAHLLDDQARHDLSRVLRGAPGALAAVLVGRREVELPSAAVRDVDSSVLIDGRDLLFSPDEAGALATAVAPQLDQQAVANAVRQGAGWGAGLVLAARGAATGDLHLTLADHLLDQVLADLPDEAAAVLAVVAVQAVVDDVDLRVLSEGDDLAHVLRRLDEDGVLVRYPGTEPDNGVWGMLPLLRLLLEARVSSTPALAERVARLHARMARSFAARGEGERAVVHAVRADDTALLVVLLREHGADLLDPTSRSVFARALERLPDDVRTSDPSVLVLAAMLARLELRVGRASELSAAADRAMAALPEGWRPEASQDHLALMRLWRSRCGWADPHTAIASARERLGCRHEQGDDMHTLRPGQSQVWSSWLMGELATVQIVTGDLAGASLHLRELVYNGQALGLDRMIAVGLAHRSFLELVDGSFETAAATARRSLDLSASGGVGNRSHVGWAHFVVAWSALHRLDLIDAHAHLAQAEERSLELDPLLSELLGLLRARLLAEEGMVEDSRRALAEHMGSDSPTAPAFLRRLAAIALAQTAGLTNDVPTVWDQVAVLVEVGFPDDAALFSAVAQVGEGRLDDALATVEEVLTHRALSPPVGAGAAALRLGLLLRTGQRTRAAELLPDLLARVAPQNLLQILSIGFLGGAAFGDLLEAEATRPDGHPFAAVALGGLSRYARPAAGVGTRPVGHLTEKAPDPGSPVSLLTRREREVLVELSYGGSYADVAQSLFVSENTVKTHLASVYRKLQVERRVDALRIAREHHLL